MGLTDRVGAAVGALINKPVSGTTPEYKESVAEVKKAAVSAVKGYEYMRGLNDTQFKALDEYVKNTAKAIAGLTSVPDIKALTAGIERATKSRSQARMFLKTPYKRDAQGRIMFDETEKMLRDIDAIQRLQQKATTRIYRSKDALLKFKIMAANSGNAEIAAQANTLLGQAQKLYWAMTERQAEGNKYTNYPYSNILKPKQMLQFLLRFGGELQKYETQMNALVQQGKALAKKAKMPFEYSRPGEKARMGRRLLEMEVTELEEFLDAYGVKGYDINGPNGVVRVPKQQEGRARDAISALNREIRKDGIGGSVVVDVVAFSRPGEKARMALNDIQLSQGRDAVVEAGELARKCEAKMQEIKQALQRLPAIKAAINDAMTRQDKDALRAAMNALYSMDRVRASFARLDAKTLMGMRSADDVRNRIAFVRNEIKTAENRLQEALKSGDFRLAFGNCRNLAADYQNLGALYLQWEAVNRQHSRPGIRMRFAAKTPDAKAKQAYDIMRKFDIKNIKTNADYDRWEKIVQAVLRGPDAEVDGWSLHEKARDINRTLSYWGAYHSRPGRKYQAKRNAKRRSTV